MFDNQLCDRIGASAKQYFKNLLGSFFTRMPVTTNVLQSIKNSTNCNEVQIKKKVQVTKFIQKSDMIENDDALYCFCNQVEHGKMIGCDNEACEKE
jgi:hypothetical protein